MKFTENDKNNEIYWSYNLPLQLWPIREDDEDDNSKIIDYRIVNYMPRKESICEMNLSKLEEDQTREEIFEQAAKYFENLARLFRKAITDKEMHIYYHDEEADNVNS